MDRLALPLLEIERDLVIDAGIYGRAGEDVGLSRSYANVM